MSEQIDTAHKPLIIPASADGIFKVGIIGSRDVAGKNEIYDNSEYVAESLDSLFAALGLTADTTLIISGGSKGTEVLAQTHCEANAYTVEVITPRMNDFRSEADGATAAFRERNNRIISEVDIMIFYWDGVRTIIRECITNCNTYKKPSIVLPLK